MTDARTLTSDRGGDWHGGYGLAPCPVCQTEGRPDQRALSVKDGERGLLLHCHKSGCDFRSISQVLRGMGLLDGADRGYAPDPAREARRRAEEAADVSKRSRRAERLWEESRPIAGTLAEGYLRFRGINEPWPNTRRFHPKCKHPSRRYRPAMIARVDGGEVFSVHRTYLAEPGRKADVTPQKAMLAPVKGGAVVLSTGTGPLVVAEGIETALSLRDAMADPDAMVLAALSTSGMASLALGPTGRMLVIAPDPGPPGLKAARSLAGRAQAAGREVRILPPPEGGGDWNDWAQARAGAA